MNTLRKSKLFLVLALLVVTVGSLAGVSVAAERPAITIAQLSGPWQIALVGNTGCGVTSLQFNGTLNTSGTSTGTLTDSSGCGLTSSTATFSIITLNTNGSGTAGLTCGTGCGWTFNIQVTINKQMFNLVDVVNSGSNVLAGTAVKQ